MCICIIYIHSSTGHGEQLWFTMLHATNFCLVLLDLLDGKTGGGGWERKCQGKCPDKMKAGKQAELLEIT